MDKQPAVIIYTRGGEVVNVESNTELTYRVVEVTEPVPNEIVTVIGGLNGPDTVDDQLDITTGEKTAERVTILFAGRIIETSQRSYEMLWGGDRKRNVKTGRYQ